jgi:hypothetical protein
VAKLEHPTPRYKTVETLSPTSYNY